jgi:hypothetical protein
MNIKVVATMLLGCSVALAADAPTSYDEAETIWQRTKDTVEYQTYVAEFVQLNNLFRIDERDGCYSLTPEPVDLMLVVSRANDKGVATVERVFYHPDSAKARCFERSYRGIPTKAAPFWPFVVQLRME